MAGHDKTGRSRGEPFTMLTKSLMRSEAYRALAHASRSVLAEMLVGVTAERNGAVERSYRSIANDANVSVSTVERAVGELKAAGFIVCTAQGYKGQEGRGVGSMWRFTHLGTRAEPKPTREYLKPAGETAPTRQKNKSLSLPRGHSVPTVGTRKRPSDASPCPRHRDKEGAIHTPQDRYDLISAMGRGVEQGENNQPAHNAGASLPNTSSRGLK